MKKNVRFEIAKKDIIAHFDSLAEKILSLKDISRILDDKREFWRLSKSLTVKGFIELLLNGTMLKEYVLNFPHRRIILYSWGEVPILSVALALNKDAYLSHYSAVFFHNLTDQIPKTIYINVEQGEKKTTRQKLVQENIDRAFANRQRMSNNTAVWNDYKICILNGKFTNKLGVIETQLEDKAKIFSTNVERTLIDITVRPAYSGGVFEVLNAFRLAKEKVSINKLAATLKKLDYVYPYHQAIGFYVERSQCYKESQIKLLKKIPIIYDFYLAHGMKEVEYSKEWKLYYPREF